MATKLLKAERNNHAIQTFGNATLATGQLMMATSSFTGQAPLLFAGLAATLTSVAVNSGSELIYRAYQNAERNLDELEEKIITEVPQFSAAEFRNLNKTISDHAAKRIIKFELLGHLHAPQFVLYQKYSSENSGFFAYTVNAAGKRMANMLGNLPTKSIALYFISREYPQKISHKCWSSKTI